MIKGPTNVYFGFFKKLKDYNVKLNNIVDVGCYKGDWTKAFKNIFPDANYYLIDANDQYQAECKQLGTFIQAAVGFKEEERPYYFYKLGSDTGNSLYKETSNAVPEVEKKVQVKPLSKILPEQPYDYIKMDVQGAELEIIDGSFSLFEKTKFVQLECPVHYNNVDAPRFEHYINYMANCGFRVFDIDSIFMNRKLMGIDFVFVNTKLPMATELENEKILYESYMNVPSA